MGSDPIFPLELVRLLLDQANINVNICDKNGDSALHNAAYNNNLQIIELLLKKDCIDANIQSKKLEKRIANGDNFDKEVQDKINELLQKNTPASYCAAKSGTEISSNSCKGKT